MKKMVSFLLAGTLVISCFAFPASAKIIDGDGPIFDSNDAYSGLIDGEGPTEERDDDFPDTLAQPVIEQIAALGEITSLDQKAAVEAVRAAYEKLTDAQKAFVSNYADLQAAEAKIADLTAAKVVIDQIAALGEITLAKEDAVKAARAAYDALTDAQKTLVTNEKTLADAEKKIADLKADKAAADAVVAQIDALGEITSYDQKASVDAAREAYDKLTDAQKKLVPKASVDALEAAEAAIAKLAVKLGDVDNDGKVTVSDVVQLRKLIVAGSWTDREFAAGNLDDSDENLTVSDVVALRALIVAGA